MKQRDSLQHGGVPAVRENTSVVGFSDLAEERITRSRAIKLAGAVLGTGAFALILPDEADAANRKRRRRRRRRARLRRQRNVTSDQSTINFGDTLLGAPVTRAVEVSNNGPDRVTLNPTLVGDGFTLLDTDPIILDPGETRLVNVTFDALREGVSTGTLRLVDARDGLLLEAVDLVGNVDVL